MTDDLDRPTNAGIETDGAEGVAGPVGEVFSPAELVAAGDALGSDGAMESATISPGPVDAESTESGRTGTGDTGLAGPDPVPAAAPIATGDPGDASLLGLIDRLGSILERSDLTEIEVEAGRTTVLLRKPVAVPMAQPSGGSAGDGQPTGAGIATAGDPGRDGQVSGGKAGGSAVQARPSVRAPLTGIWYGSPTPGSAPFVEVGRELAVGQVVGLIEAMKLFNEIKSDLAGRVVRVVPDSGTLVKAKQPLIEVEPL